MNADELAQAIVSCGVGHRIKSKTFLDGMYTVPKNRTALPADNFIRDGCVVLAMMEKCKLGFDFWWNDMHKAWEVLSNHSPQATISENESLAIAINTACCKAIGDSNGLSNPHAEN